MAASESPLASRALGSSSSGESSRTRRIRSDLSLEEDGSVLTQEVWDSPSAMAAKMEIAHAAAMPTHAPALSPLAGAGTGVGAVGASYEYGDSTDG